MVLYYPPGIPHGIQPPKPTVVAGFIMPSLIPRSLPTFLLVFPASPPNHMVLPLVLGTRLCTETSQAPGSITLLQLPHVPATLLEKGISYRGFQGS